MESPSRSNINATNERLVDMINSGVETREDISVQPQVPPKTTLLPMSPLAASATVINLVLATGPFR